MVIPRRGGSSGYGCWLGLNWGGSWGRCWSWGGDLGVPSVKIGVQASTADISRLDWRQPGEDIEEGLSNESLRSSEDVGEEGDEWINQVAWDWRVPNGSGEGDQSVNSTVHVRGETDLSLADQPHGLNELTGSVQEDKSGDVCTNGADVEAVLNETTDDGGCGTGDIGSGDSAGVGHTVKGIQQVVPHGLLDGSLVDLTNGANCLFKAFVVGEEEGFIAGI